MHVVATAGHVDHGKSTLVRALTGMEPDRWAEERRRGMTIDLGFAWTALPDGSDIAFVDVPGHERFITNMLAGVGPVPAVLFVVAADEGWQAQSEEHLRVADVVGVRHGVVAVTKADRGEPQTVAADVVRRLAPTSLRDAEVVTVSAATRDGLDLLRAALSRLVAGLPAPDPHAPVRLWVDRSFTIRGAGTVVTGTLPAGVLRTGSDLELTPAGLRVGIRALESMKKRTDEVAGVARVAVNLRGVERADVRRGMALVTPDRWSVTDTVDAVVSTGELPRDVVVHVGSAAVPAQVRRLGPYAVRLRLAEALPLHVGDRLLVREPASRAVAAADVADVAPQPLRRRGEATSVAASLAVPRSADDVLARHAAVRAADLLRAGLSDPPAAARSVDGWWVTPEQWAAWTAALAAAVGDEPVDIETVRGALGVPDAGLMRALVAESERFVVEGGRIRLEVDARPDPPEVAALVERLAADPFDAPAGEDVAPLDRRALADAARGGRLLHLAGALYVGPAAPDLAVDRLRELPAPFTVSAARQALGVSRRVAVPLLEHLDAVRRTRRLPDGTRVVVTAG